MFRGVKPEGQPRTLRTIAEDGGASPAGFEGALPYSPQAGMPASEQGATQLYHDDVASTREQQAGGGPVTAAEPRPFVVRGK